MAIADLKLHLLYHRMFKEDVQQCILYNIESFLAAQSSAIRAKMEP